MRLPLAASLILTAAVVILSPSAAEATFPGKPGPIAFERDIPFKLSGEIFAVDRQGAEARRLSSVGGFDPDYSPDGGRIAFDRRTFNQPDEVFTMGADGSSPARVPTSCRASPCLGDSSPAWSPDGNRLVFERAFGPVVGSGVSGVDLVTAKSDGSSERVVLHFRSLEGQGKEPHDAQWSPDGRRIAVTMLNIKAKPRRGSAIYVLRADGSHLRRITPLRLNAGLPDWSPRGKLIVFSSSYSGGKVNNQIYTVRPSGRALRRLRKKTKKGSNSFMPVWSPDGKRIAFARNGRHWASHIWTMKPNGKGLQQVTTGAASDVKPDWGTR